MGGNEVGVTFSNGCRITHGHGANIKKPFTDIDLTMHELSPNNSKGFTGQLGFIEFMGDKATDPAAREEIVVVGLTIYYTMLLRMNNIFQLFGAVAAKPGYPKNENEDEHEMYAPEATSSSRDVDVDAKTAHARVSTVGSSSSSRMKPVEG